MPVETKTFLNQALLANYCRTGEIHFEWKPGKFMPCCQS